MKTREFLDLLTEECTDCNKGSILVPAYGNSMTTTKCYTCRGTLKRPSEVGRELLRFIKTYGERW